MKSIFFIYFLFFITSSSSSSSPFTRESLPTKSGYLQVNSTSGSSIFYAFYEAQKPISSIEETPLLIWLQGGPGGSSMLGNFFELGPWRVNQDIELEPNAGSWNRIFGLVFVDSPIGTGFSIAGNSEDVPRDQNRVAEHLYVAIKEFIKLDINFKSRPVYITGESYAGKYAPALGYYILNKNKRVEDKDRVNLGGIAVGNGLTDPVSQVTTHGKNAYYTGLINDNQRIQLEVAQNEVVRLVGQMKWSEANDARNSVLEMLQNMTGLATLYDMRRKIPYQSELVAKFLNKTEVKKALGVDPAMVWEECSETVSEIMHKDMMKSVKYMVEFLLKESKVLLYQGQCDLRDGVVSNEEWMKRLKWEGITEFLRGDRKVWKVKGDVAGYVQKYKSLSHVVVLSAGHYVPFDQGLHSQGMIEDWVLEKGLFGNFEIGGLESNIDGNPF